MLSINRFCVEIFHDSVEEYLDSNEKYLIQNENIVGIDMEYLNQNVVYYNMLKNYL